MTLCKGYCPILGVIQDLGRSWVLFYNSILSCLLHGYLLKKIYIMWQNINSEMIWWLIFKMIFLHPRCRSKYLWTIIDLICWLINRFNRGGEKIWIIVIFNPRKWTSAQISLLEIQQSSLKSSRKSAVHQTLSLSLSVWADTFHSVRSPFTTFPRANKAWLFLLCITNVLSMVASR